jgi:hypothetical protein
MNSYVECKAILELDLDPIKVKLMHRQSGEGWTAAQASAVEIEYRRFLYLKKAFPNDDITPLEQVDTFWHYHILDTMKYAEDCEVIFGQFLHHFPYSGMRGEEDLAHHQQLGDRTRTLYLQAFGDDYYERATACGSAGSAGTAWCNATVSNASARGTTTAWCNVTGEAAGSKRPVTAWCNVTGEAAGSTRPVTAWCNVTGEAAASKRAVTAWCNVTGKAAGSTRPVTAWCNVTGKAAGSIRPVTAWCNVTGEAAGSKGTGTAWCNATVNAAGLKALSASPGTNGIATSWCNATVGSKRRTDFVPARPRLHEEALAA